MSQSTQARKELIDSLNAYLDQEESDETFNFEAINSGHRIHNAVVVLQRKVLRVPLPLPTPRLWWRRLLRWSRRTVKDPYSQQAKRRSDAILFYGGSLLHWAQDELPKLKTKRKRKRGPYQTAYDPEADAKPARDWKAAKHNGTRFIEEFAKDRGLDEDDVRAAIERHRKRPASR